MTSSKSQLDVHGIDVVGHIETRGVDYIPIDERHSTPREIGYVFFGTQLCFGIIVLGFLPVTFGLGFWGSITSTLVGLAVGSAVFAPLALLSTRTGTNSAVSSGAHFGVVGRIVGSVVGLLTAVGFYAITVWTGGQALVAGLNRLFSLPYNNWTLGVAYALIGTMTLIVAIYGHANVVLANRILIPTMGVLLLIGVFVLAPKFNVLPPAGDDGLLLGSYVPTWILAATAAASLPISYSPYVGDYTRYVSPAKWSSARLVVLTGLGMFLGCAVALCFAIYVAMAFAPNTTDWVVGFVDVVPASGAVPIILISLAGSCAQGALCVYGTGLDTSSIIPALPRVTATLIVGFIGTGLVYIGSFAYNLVGATTAFLILLLVVTAPWLVINLVGYVLSKGRYHAYDLQVFNMTPKVHGGAYWFTKGWNIAGMTAWVVATFVGMLFVNTSLFVGPLANVAGGIDLSFISSAVLGGLIYFVMAKLIPSTVVAPRNHSEADDRRRLEDMMKTVAVHVPSHPTNVSLAQPEATVE